MLSCRDGVRRTWYVKLHGIQRREFACTSEPISSSQSRVTENGLWRKVTDKYRSINYWTERLWSPNTTIKTGGCITQVNAFCLSELWYGISKHCSVKQNNTGDCQSIKYSAASMCSCGGYDSNSLISGSIGTSNSLNMSGVSKHNSRNYACQLKLEK